MCLRRNIKMFSWPTLLFVLFGCGGGGGEGGGLPTTTGVNSTRTYAYYLDSSGGISIYDPENPGTPGMQVAAATQYFSQPMFGGTYSAPNRRADDVHTRAIVYSSTGKLWKLDTTNVSVVPVPVQVSSEAALVYAGPAADLLCNIQLFPDFANASNSRILYTKTSGVSACGTTGDQLYSTTLGANSSTSSTTHASGWTVLAPIYDVTNGALSGFLLRNGNVVGRVATNLGGYVQVDTVADNAATAHMLNNGKIFLIEDDGASKVFKLYDPTSAVSGSNPSAALLTVSSGHTVYTASGAANVQFVVDATAGTIYRLWPDGSAPVTMATGETANAIRSIRLTATRLVYVWNDGVNTKIRAIDKLAENAVPDDLFQATNTSLAGSGVYFPDKTIKDELRFDGAGLFFTVEYSGALAKDACRVSENGGPVMCSSSTANEFWTGYIGATIYDFGSTSISRVILARDDGVNTALTAYSVESGLPVATMTPAAALPAGASIQIQTHANNYNTTLFVGASPDVWHARTEVSGSMVRMTNTLGTAAIGATNTE